MIRRGRTVADAVVVPFPRARPPDTAGASSVTVMPNKNTGIRPGEGSADLQPNAD